jgi:hypothetical protein
LLLGTLAIYALMRATGGSVAAAAVKPDDRR